MNFSLPPLAASSIATQGAPASTVSSANTSNDPQHRKLVDAAQQFEGMLLQELLKPMREQSFGSGDTDSSNDDSESSSFTDTLSSFGSESLATAISRSGGLGIAKQVVQQVDREHAAHTSQNADPSSPVQGAPSPILFSKVFLSKGLGLKVSS